MQNVIERMRAERRRERVRDVLAFVGYALSAGAVLFVFWVAIWSGCALVDSCYYSNI